MSKKKISLVIENSDELQMHCQKALKKRYVAFDTEFFREKGCYWPSPSLIQFCYDGKKSIICDLKNDSIDWSSLRELLTNEKILKIFHSARQDIEVLQYFFKIKLCQIFDTQIAAAFLGENETIGYDKLVKKLLNIGIDKTLQFSNWESRPLSEAQIEYAAYDVKYLYDLYPKLRKVLEKKYHWAQNEMSVLFQNHVEKKSQSIFRKFIVPELGKSIDTSTLQKAIIYSKIIHFREQQCCSKNKSHNAVISDIKIEALKKQLMDLYPHSITKEILLPIFQKMNIDENISIDIADFLEEQSRKYDEDIEKMKTILQRLMDKKFLMAHVVKNPIYYLIKTLLHTISLKNNIAHSIIADNHDISEIILSKNLTSKFTHGWRHEVFGSHLKKLFTGNLTISLDQKQSVKVQWILPIT